MQPPIENEAAGALRAEILEVLNGVIDPCSAATAVPAGLVDMGLIRALRFEPLGENRWRCSVRLCVTHAFCMMTGVFVNEIGERLRRHSKLGEVEIDLDHSTIWTEELMSPQYRARLQAHRSKRRLA